MAATSHASNVVILDSEDDDDIRILYSSPTLVEKGHSSSNPISIDSHSDRTRSRKRKRVIHINIDDDDDQMDIDHKLTCEICTDEKPRSEFFRIKGCTHCYCCECTSKYVSSKLQENNAYKIGCPSPGCDAGRVELQDCRWILPREVFDRWGAALCEAMIPDSEKFYCPYKDCSALLIHDGGGQLGVPCPNCRRMLCAKCRVPWHSGMTCQEFTTKNEWERDGDTQLISLAEKKKWRRCPSCEMFVEKISGCNSVRCRCGFSFCYSTGQPYGQYQRVVERQNAGQAYLRMVERQNAGQAYLSMVERQNTAGQAYRRGRRIGYALNMNGPMLP